MPENLARGFCQKRSILFVKKEEKPISNTRDIIPIVKFRLCYP